MARTPLKTALWAPAAPSSRSPEGHLRCATSASGDRGAAETIPFVGIQKCRALICFYDALYSLPRDRSEKRPQACASRSSARLLRPLRVESGSVLCLGCTASSCLRAATSPARQPGARPPDGGLIDCVAIPLRAIAHAITELEFHISPVPSSSRPHTGVGTRPITSRRRRARSSSSVSRRGLSTASATSGMCPPRHTRIS